MFNSVCLLVAPLPLTFYQRPWITSRSAVPLPLNAMPSGLEHISNVLVGGIDAGGAWLGCIRTCHICVSSLLSFNTIYFLPLHQHRFALPPQKLDTQSGNYEFEVDWSCLNRGLTWVEPMWSCVDTKSMKLGSDDIPLFGG